MDPLDEVLDRGYRYAMSLTHDPVEAEDLLHDAWVSVLKGGGPRTGAYLIHAVRSRWIDAHRRARIVPMVPLLEPAQVAAEQRGIGDAAADRQQIELLLGELGAEQREILFLSVVEGWSTAEIGQLLERPRNTVLSMLHRAKLKLRALVSPRQREIL